VGVVTVGDAPESFLAGCLLVVVRPRGLLLRLVGALGRLTEYNRVIEDIRSDGEEACFCPVTLTPVHCLSVGHEG